MKLSDFDYSLPQGLIAQKPAEIRDCSRLMLLDRASGKIQERIFKDIVTYLCPGDLLVLNDTRVFPARLYGKKAETGGKIEILLVHQRQKGEWVCLIRGCVHIGQRLIFAENFLSGRIIEHSARGEWVIKFDWKGDFFQLLQQYGQVPLPPYIKRKSLLTDDKERYQTVFAQYPGAVAAPTAGLHFTETLLKNLKGKGVEIAFVTLHVGPGTFKPIRTEKIEEHVMDEEIYSVDTNTLQVIRRAKENGRRVIAVGTTTTRILETLFLNTFTTAAEGAKIEGRTDLFITPGFHFRAVDALITNFHLPRSTLLILVCAFAGYDLTMRAYQHAVENKYRFYSYGDAMFII